MRRAGTAQDGEGDTPRTPLDPPVGAPVAGTSGPEASGARADSHAASHTPASRAPGGTAEPGAPAVTHHRARRAKLYVEAILLVALVVLVVLLALDNRDQARVGWLVGDTTASVVWIVLASAILGWLAGIVTAVIFRRRTRPTEG